MQGDDLPIEIQIRVDVEHSLIILLSHLPFLVGKEKRLYMAVAISIVNNVIVDGSFDFVIKS